MQGASVVNAPQLQVQYVQPRGRGSVTSYPPQPQVGTGRPQVWCIYTTPVHGPSHTQYHCNHILNHVKMESHVQPLWLQPVYVREWRCQVVRLQISNTAPYLPNILLIMARTIFQFNYSGAAMGQGRGVSQPVMFSVQQPAHGVRSAPHPINLVHNYQTRHY